MKKRIFKALKYLSVSVLALSILFFCLVFYPMSNIGFPEKDYNNIIINNINIVDVENDTIYKNRFILITDNKIKRISDNPILSNNERLKIVEASNKFLIPALWDMHVHLGKQSPLSAHAEFVVNGVMHVRDMRGAYNDRDPFATTPKRISKWNKEIEEFSLLSPKIHSITSHAVEGPHPMFENSPKFFNCSNEQEAKLLVAYFKKQGVDLIKMYNNIPRKAFFKLMKEARAAGIDVAGHKPAHISTIEASNAGMKSLEHARFLIWDSYGGAEKLRNRSNLKLLYDTDLREKMLTEHDSVLLNENLKTMKENQTWYCPTHLTRKSDAYADDSTFRAKYDSINPILRFLSFEDLDGTVQEDTTLRGRKVYKDFYLKSLEITKKASEKGVQILAGSDVPELPGTSLLDELEELSKAGLSNYEVLRTATLRASQYYNVDNQYGTIEVDKIADMVILSQNPISEISNIRSIEGIVYDGHYIDKGKIGKIKKTIYSRNSGIVISAKLVWDIILFMTL